jgi:hypothetical protein
MLTPSIHIIAFLSAAFVLGVALGWVLWKFKSEPADSEVQFWKQRWDQSRLELDREHDKIEILEKERDSLKDKLKAASDKLAEQEAETLAKLEADKLLEKKTKAAK